MVRIIIILLSHGGVVCIKDLRHGLGGFFGGREGKRGRCVARLGQGVFVQLGDGWIRIRSSISLTRRE